MRPHRAKALNVSKGVVAKYVALASATGLDERQLTGRLLPRSPAGGRYVEPDWAAKSTVPRP